MHEHLKEEQLIEVLWKRGDRLVDKDEPEEALKYLMHLKARRPDDVACLNRIGVAYAKMEQLEAAEQYFRQALTIDPKYAPAHSNLGNLLYTRGDYEGAIGKYRQALSLDPGYYTAQRNLAAALRKTGRIAEAVSALKASDRSRTKKMIAPRQHDAAEGEKTQHKPRGCWYIIIGALLLLLLIWLVVNR